MEAVACIHRVVGGETPEVRANNMTPEVFLVDDDAPLLDELSEFVSRHGLSVSAFTDSRQALEVISQQAMPFVLVTDIGMPGLNGHALIKRLKEMAGTLAPYKVIMMSGQAQFDDAVKAIEEGVMDFLPKPVDARALLHTIGRAGDALLEDLQNDNRLEELEAQLHEAVRTTESLADNIRSLLGGERLAAAVLDDRPDRAPDVLEPDNGFPKPVPSPSPSNVTPFPSAADASDARDPEAIQKSLRVLDRPAQAGNITPVTAPHATLALIKLLQSIKRVRDKFFPECAQGDPSWDIILYVLEQDLLNRPVSVTSACHATLIPQTTAMRKIEEMVAQGLMIRDSDPDDRRRILVAPTEMCREHARMFLGGVLNQTLGAVHPEALPSETKQEAAE